MSVRIAAPSLFPLQTVFTLEKGTEMQIRRKVPVKPQANEGERNVQPSLFTSMYMFGLVCMQITSYEKTLIQ